MKYVRVPAEITVKNPITKEPLKFGLGHPREGKLAVYSLHGFLLDSILNDTKIGRGVEALRRVRKLDTAFEDAKPGDLVGVEDADYTVVKLIMTDLELRSPLQLAQLLPFFDAWADAEKQDEDWKRRQAKPVQTEAALA